MVDKSTMDQCLKDISFPITREEIADCAAGNSCPRQIVTQLREMHLASYRSEDDVLCHLGNIAYC